MTHSYLKTVMTLVTANTVTHKLFNDSHSHITLYNLLFLLSFHADSFNHFNCVAVYVYSKMFLSSNKYRDTSFNNMYRICN